MKTRGPKALRTPDVARHVLDRGAQHEARLAERDLVADRGAEHATSSEALGDRAAASRRAAPTRRPAPSRSCRRTGSRGRRPAPARAASSRRRAAGPWRRSSRRARPRPAGRVGRRAPRRAAPRRRSREGTGRGEREVGAEQRARLALHRLAQVVGEGVDGHERGDADRHRRRTISRPAPPRAAGLAPGAARG